MGPIDGDAIRVTETPANETDPGNAEGDSTSETQSLRSAAYARSSRSDPSYEGRLYRVPAEEIELRAKADGSPLIAGYGAVFNRRSSVISEWGGEFIERIQPGAFTKTLRQNGDVLATFNHDRNFILGRGSNGTLRLTQDSQGVEYEIDPTPTQWASDLIKQIDRKDIKGASFGFRMIRDAWGTCAGPNGSDVDERTLLEVQLYDIGPVAEGAYPDATSSLRSLLKASGFDPDLLRDFVKNLDGFRELVEQLQELRRTLPSESIGAPGAPVRTGHPPVVAAPTSAPRVTSHADRELFARLDGLSKYLVKG